MARARLSRVRQDAEYRGEAKRVFIKHGSRKKQNRGKRAMSSPVKDTSTADLIPPFQQLTLDL